MLAMRLEDTELTNRNDNKSFTAKPMDNY